MTEAKPIDPRYIIDYNLTEAQKQRHLLFCMFVAGKNADQIAKKHNAFCELVWLQTSKANTDDDLLTRLHSLGKDRIEVLLRQVKMGRYSVLAKGLYTLANWNTTVHIVEAPITSLEKISGIGPKTARFFVTTTRENAKHAVLDTHILRYMREELGVQTPKSTPSGKRYRELEKLWLDHCKALGVDSTQYDLDIWVKYSGRNNDKT